MRAAFLITIAAVFICILLLNAALEWARREPGRKFPDGVMVKLYGDDYLVLSARYYRGRWWYTLDGIPFEIKQEEIG